MGKLPSLAPCRALTSAAAGTPIAATSRHTTSTPFSAPRAVVASQVRHATFVPRPRRPYTFTQLVQLSDGSTYTMRSTSPLPLYRAAKDTRNTLLWQPSEKSLRNVELDEAGKLAAFRERFGRGYDASAEAGEEGAGADADAQAGADQGDGFADLITGYAPQDASAMKDSGPKKSPTRRK